MVNPTVQKLTMDGLDALAESLRLQYGAVPSDTMMGYFLLGLALGALAEAGDTLDSVNAMVARMMPVASAAVEASSATWQPPWKREAAATTLLRCGACAAPAGGAHAPWCPGCGVLRRSRPRG